MAIIIIIDVKIIIFYDGLIIVIGSNTINDKLIPLMSYFIPLAHYYIVQSMTPVAHLNHSRGRVSFRC